ncbi:uncharacterized protein LOC118201068 [Stegodyphus dumicola]|uniref:uncharacterized protein LOC118201068 n=1 Tax=Stegodyphus dumicola TaxID=202533 RepID=UPI0015B12CB2|nr:uncharacterized protein LOC118201068 [Stegodyphus dumicola]
MEEKTFWKINLLLLPVKIHYFLFMAALACALPFRTVFAKQLGISATAIGVIFLAVPFLKIFTNPLFGFIVDYFKKFRLVLTVLMLIVALTHVAMVFIPPRLVTTSKAADFTNYLRIKHVHYNCSEEISNKRNIDLYMWTRKTSEIISFQNRNLTCQLHCYASQGLLNNKESTDYIELCDKNVSFIIAINIKIKDCKLEILPKDENVSIVMNNVSTIARVKSVKIPGEDDRNLSCNTYEANKRNYPPNMFNNVSILTTTQTYENISRKILNDSHSTWYFYLSKDNVFDYLQNDYTVFSINNKRNFIDCHCKAQLQCFIKDCHFNLKTTHLLLDEHRDDSEEFLSEQFWGLFILIGVSSVTFCAVIFLMDAVCYEMLGHRIDLYGQQRLWGTIGWGIGALVGGYLNDIASVSSVDIDYSFSFYLLAVLTLLDLIPVCKLKVENVHYSLHICKDVGLLLSKPSVVFYVFIVFAIGVLSGLIWNYQFWFMEEIGASQVLLGLSQTFECIVAELPCFLISGWIIRKVGHINCNSITLLCFGLRYLCFAYMQDPWLTLPVALLHGPTFGIFYSSMTMYGKSEAPPGTEASVQALLAVAFEGVGAGTGSILGGIGFDKFGSRNTFLYAAVASFILLLLNLFAHLLLLRTEKYKEPERPMDIYEKIEKAEKTANRIAFIQP